MGYERNDRRYGGPNFDRDRYDHGAYGGQGRPTSYGYGARDYRGDRFDDRADNGRSEHRGSNYGGWDDPRDRGFMDRAGDEVRSWFGDEEAERRRREDAVYDERLRSYGSGDYTRSDYGYRGSADRDSARGYGADRGRTQQDRSHDTHYDHSYHSWRDREIQALDRDYHDYRRENQSRFDSEFGSWRKGRQGQRTLLEKVQEHQEVVGSDGSHVGTVDHVRGDHIRLTKQDAAAGGHHHAIPSSWIQSVDDKVTLTKTADQAKQHWRDDERSGGKDGLFGGQSNDRDVNLNRSFSGTY